MAREIPENADVDTRDIDNRHAETYPTPHELGRLLPQYRVDSQIGQGGMGAVYRAYQPSLDRPVAIKIMSARFANEPSFAERFAREARTMAKLGHQNIVNVYDYGQTDKICYLVMEYVDGVNLRRAMREGTLTAEQGLAIVPQVCEALQFAHDEGIIHRDIKPENILLDKKGRVKIADFGLAKLIDNDPKQFTLTGSRQILGTVNYMAPEQIERPNSVDHRADIYSLGVVLYELLTGELPLGRFRLPGEKFAGHAALDQVVVRTLEKEPERRFQQASEFRTAVEQARSSSGFRPIGTPPSAPPVTSEQQLQPKPSGIRLPRVAYTSVNPWHGLTMTRGIISADKNDVIINYATRDNIIKSSILSQSGKHVLPFALISNAEFHEGWFRHVIVLTIDVVDDYIALPTKTPGTLTFSVDSLAVKDARTVVNAIRAGIGQPPLPVTLEKPEIKRAKVQKRLAWPAVGIAATALINTAILPLLFIATWFLAGANEKFENASTVSVSTPMIERQTAENNAVKETNSNTGMKDVEQSVAQSTIRESFGLGITARQTFAWNLVVALAYLVIGAFLLSGAYSMSLLRNWRWCLAMSILCIIPIHPGFFLGIPVGICSIVQLSRFNTREEFE